MSILQQLKQLEKVRQVQEAKRIAALDRLLRFLTPEETLALETVLEANLSNQAVAPDVEQQADMAFAKAWSTATPEDRVLLANSTIAEAW
ncbi:MAG: hypothetical protein GY832_09685 [Chloroflexi bacterium]|nr:hypothetical protein [Chloroflexota bacterium]